jgi:hypothetical protein
MLLLLLACARHIPEPPGCTAPPAASPVPEAPPPPTDATPREP